MPFLTSMFVSLDRRRDDDCLALYGITGHDTISVMDKASANRINAGHPVRLHLYRGDSWSFRYNDFRVDYSPYLLAQAKHHLLRPSHTPR